MIVVLDTNIIISALLSPGGNAAAMIQRWQAEAFDVSASAVMVEEIGRALAYEHVRRNIRFSDDELLVFLDDLQSMILFVDPQETLDVIKEDQADNRILECALAAKASFIVTGDHHLLQIKEYHGIIMLPPAGFLALLEMAD